ncbi:conserved hypothetical protein [Halorhabdus tiamatea SARL4B]|nr:Uncharacterized protein HBNXHr_1401 [Halorhabdus sp. BNX81]CCQ32178.1 conserved hypothetical protein [Halorhabdus tiamatea SARL4B]
MLRHGEFERIRAVLRESDLDEPLTAREIHDVLEAHDESFESPHEIATVLGRHAETGAVEVIRGHPYRYRFDDRGQ